MFDGWTRFETGDNDPGVWVDALAWDDDEAYNDGWLVVEKTEADWVPA